MNQPVSNPQAELDLALVNVPPKAQPVPPFSAELPPGRGSA